jgi:hypothetical protein
MQFEGATLKDTHTLPASTATLVQIIPDRGVVCLSHAGDSFCIFFFTNGHSKFITTDRNRDCDNKMFQLMEKISKEKNITPSDARQDEIVKQALLDMRQDTYNRPDGAGQGIINGSPHAEQYMQDVEFSLNSIQAILLGTDGLIPPGWDEQDEEDRGKLLAAIKKGGLEEVIRIKKEIEDNDPDRYIIRYKHSDDATGILIEMR